MAFRFQNVADLFRTIFESLRMKPNTLVAAFAQRQLALSSQLQPGLSGIEMPAGGLGQQAHLPETSPQTPCSLPMTPGIKRVDIFEAHTASW